MHMRYHFIVLYILIQSSVVCMQGMERQLIDRGFQVGDDEEVELQFLCDECQRLFKTERGLKAHKTRKHTIQESQLENDSTYAGQSSVTPFQCDMCPCMFTTQRGLNNHQISQHGVPRDWSFHPPALSRLKRVPESVALDRAIYAAQVGPGIPKPLAGSPKDESDLRRRLELSPAYVADSPLRDAAAHKTTSGNSSPTIYFDTPTAAMGLTPYN